MIDWGCLFISIPFMGAVDAAPFFIDGNIGPAYGKVRNDVDEVAAAAIWASS